MEHVDIWSIPLTTISGEETTLETWRGKTILIVNVASKCGHTKQYAALQELYEKYGPDNFVVLGFPCNQFFKQEPGTEEDIMEFCSINYGVTFPMFSKVNVGGKQKHPLYEQLITNPDATGKAGRVMWNFEKFLIEPDETVHRFRSKTVPDAPEIVEIIDRNA